ncbi:sulfotransferase [Tenacibaculum sp. 190524A05c]|uniref:Sulfotransferase family protein n=1 Tax=Tenacibaculum platacis TaxID=3137852 RepID=A0ABP1EQW3_9FLAO
MNNISQLLLIVGAQRSGTTLLAAMLGGHSEINMLIESTNKDVLKLAGKKYSGNKLVCWRQIRMHQRPSKFGHLMNRIFNLDLTIKSSKFHKNKLYPTSKLTVQDYINQGAKIITIIRDEDEVISSMMKRVKMNVSQAKNEYVRTIEMISEIDKYQHSYHVKFSDLIHNTEVTLRNICNFLEINFEERMLQGVEYNIFYPHKEILKEKSKS